MNSRIIVLELVIILMLSAGIASALPSPEPTLPFSYETQAPKTPYLTMTISASPSTIQEGETTRITIKVENTGTGDAKSIEVRKSFHIGCNLINGSNPFGPNRVVSIEKRDKVGFEEIKSGDYRTLEYILEPRHDYIKSCCDQSPFRFKILPAVATYKDAEGNSYKAASRSIDINIQVADYDEDGWSDYKEIRMGTNPFIDDSDSDELKDFEDHNPTGLEEKKTPYLTMTTSASQSTIQQGENTTITIRIENTGTGDAKSVDVRRIIYIPLKFEDKSVGVRNIIHDLPLKFEEIKQGEYLTSEFDLTQKYIEFYSKYHPDQSYMVILQPAVATYKDVDGNLYHTTETNSLDINIQVADSDGDGGSDYKERSRGTDSFGDNSDSDELKDFEDHNPTGLEEKKTPYITLTKSASPSTIREGEATTITIQVENTGTEDAKNVEVRKRIHTGFNLINCSNCTKIAINRSVRIGKFEEIKSGDYRTLEYILEPRDTYIEHNSDQTFIRALIQPAVGTYKDVDGNSYVATSRSLNINILIVDSDGDGLNDYKEIRMGTNPFSDDSDSDGLKDPVDPPNPTGLEEKTPGLIEVWLFGGLMLLVVIMCITFVFIHDWHVQHGYSYNAILENIFGFLIAISGPILIIGGIILYIGNRSGAFPTFPFAGFITMLLGWLILLFILSTAEN